MDPRTTTEGALDLSTITYLHAAVADWKAGPKLLLPVTSDCHVKSDAGHVRSPAFERLSIHLRQDGLAQLATSQSTPGRVLLHEARR